MFLHVKEIRVNSQVKAMRGSQGKNCKLTPILKKFR